MVNIKENLWLIALVAGILGIVTIFTPAWGYSDANFYVWFFSMYIIDGDIDFIPTDAPLYSLGMIATVIIVIGTVILLFVGLFAKLKEKRIDILAIIGGVLFIIAPILVYAGIRKSNLPVALRITLVIIGIALPITDYFFFSMRCPKCNYPYRIKDTYCSNCRIKLP